MEERLAEREEEQRMVDRNRELRAELAKWERVERHMKGEPEPIVVPPGAQTRTLVGITVVRPNVSADGGKPKGSRKRQRAA